MATSPGSLAADAQELLVALAGPAARLRPDQLRAIESLVVERRRTLVLERTGWGKSAVYFIATQLLRRQGAGPTLLVSPLLALMRDQIASAQRMGVRAETINSTNLDEWSAIQGRLLAGQVDLLCISPERLNSVGFRSDVLPRLAGQIGMLVIDEAHSISVWGHDFRPDYRRIRDLLSALEGVPVLACTATANEQVSRDIAEQLGADPLTLRGSLDRESLYLSVVDMAPAERLAFLAETLPLLPGSGIVYTLTVAEAARVADFLSAQGVGARAYTSDVEPEVRLEIEAELKANLVKVVVATSALGMGFDKPDLAWVVHYGMCSSPIAYYQQVGRAGRALDRAEVILLPGPEDQRIWAFFETTAFPPEPLVRKVLARIDDAGGDQVSTMALEETVNLGRTRLESLLRVLDVDGAVERVTGGWRPTGRRWVYDADRIARVRATRRAEADAMIAYAGLTSCRMSFLRACLDDPGATEPCGRCDNCAGARFGAPADASVAEAFLRSLEVVLPVRKAWPRGLSVPRGNIGSSQRPEAGRALSLAGDGGWSPVLVPVLSGEAPLTEEVIVAFGHMLRRWVWPARPAWVTFVPSARRARVVADLAHGIAALGKLPLVEVFHRVSARPPQQEMANSAHQVINVWDAFALRTPDAGLPPGPVLLVDDVARSTWTLTVLAARLRDAGVPVVLPAVLQYR